MLRWVFFLSFLFVRVVAAQELPKTALIIGNSNYLEAPLANPVNDATDMAKVLSELGFDVMAYTDSDRRTMAEAIREFGDKLLKKGGVGLFYYAGHGIQIKGQNYLVPVNASIKSADEVEFESIDPASVLRKMETAGNDFNIIILDACRNNPFARSFRSMDKGLAKMEGPVGSIIAYATAPGSTAYDGNGRNGLYTSHLLEAMKTPGLSIEEVFKKVRVGVRDDTGGQQIPWESSSLTGHFEFLEAPDDRGGDSAQAAISPPPPPPQMSSAMGLVQVTANIAGGRVFVDGEEYGLIPGSRALNLQNLTSANVEIRVEQSGYQSQTQRIELQPGIWQQAYFELVPDISVKLEGLERNTVLPAASVSPITAPVAPEAVDVPSSPVSSEKPVVSKEFDFNSMIKPSPDSAEVPSKSQMPLFSAEPEQ